MLYGLPICELFTSSLINKTKKKKKKKKFKLNVITS